MQSFFRSKSAEKQKTASRAEDYAQIPHKMPGKAVFLNEYKEKALLQMNQSAAAPFYKPKSRKIWTRQA